MEGAVLVHHTNVQTFFFKGQSAYGFILTCEEEF